MLKIKSVTNNLFVRERFLNCNTFAYSFWSNRINVKIYLMNEIFIIK